MESSYRESRVINDLEVINMILDRVRVLFRSAIFGSLEECLEWTSLTSDARKLHTDLATFQGKIENLILKYTNRANALVGKSLCEKKLFLFLTRCKKDGLLLNMSDSDITHLMDHMRDLLSNITMGGNDAFNAQGCVMEIERIFDRYSHGK